MSRYWKAIVAAAVAVAITVVQTVLSNQADGNWTTEDTLVTVLAFLGAVGVYVTQNTTTDPQVAADESVVLVGAHARDRGAIGAVEAAVIALVIVVILVLLGVLR